MRFFAQDATMIFRNYQYRLKPTKEQEVALDFLFWQGRRVWNEALAQRIALYEEKRGNLNAIDQWAYFRDLRHANPDTLGKLNADAMGMILRRLDKAFHAFFRRVKAKKEAPGFPHFKNRQTFNSLEFRINKGASIRYDSNGAPSLYLYVANMGEIKLIYHRPIPTQAVVKQVVVRRHANKWNMSLMLELPDPVAKHPHPRRAVGIDVGLTTLAVLSNGKQIENPHWLRESLEKLRVLQRKAARQVKGSKRQAETYRQIAKLHHHVSNQRKDFLHKETRSIANGYKLVGIEDLKLAFMNRSKHLSFSSYDAGLGYLRQMLEYKCPEVGGVLVAVNPKGTSQICYKCGHVEKKKLSQRVHKCSNCGVKLDRDLNAAKNVLKLARAGVARQART